MDGHQQSRHRPSRPKERPPKGFHHSFRRHSSAPQQEDQHQNHQGEHTPGAEASTGDGFRWHPVFSPTYNHDLGGRVKPGNAMIQREQEGHYMENDPSRGAQLLHKSAVRCRTAQQLRDLDEKYHQEDGDEYARQFAHHEEEVLRMLQPPIGWHLGLEHLGPVGTRCSHRFPQGKSRDLNHALVVVTLAC